MTTQAAPLSKKLLLSTIMVLSSASNAFADADNHHLSTNPISSVLGLANLEYSYTIADHVTVGLTGNTGRVKIGGHELKGSSYGAIARLYLKPAFERDSWYAVAALKQVDYQYSVTSNQIKYAGEADKVTFAVGAGYHWFWDKFNMNLAGLISDQSKIELKDASGNKYKDDVNATVDFEFNIGWKF
jgi:Protein of unknown function (DUF3575)